MCDVCSQETQSNFLTPGGASVASTLPSTPASPAFPPPRGNSVLSRTAPPTRLWSTRHHSVGLPSRSLWVSTSPALDCAPIHLRRAHSRSALARGLCSRDGVVWSNSAPWPVFCSTCACARWIVWTSGQQSPIGPTATPIGSMLLAPATSPVARPSSPRRPSSRPFKPKRIQNAHGRRGPDARRPAAAAAGRPCRDWGRERVPRSLRAPTGRWCTRAFPPPPPADPPKSPLFHCVLRARRRLPLPFLRWGGSAHVVPNACGARPPRPSRRPRGAALFIARADVGRRRRRRIRRRRRRCLPRRAAPCRRRVRCPRAA